MLADLGEPVLPRPEAGFTAVRVLRTHGFPHRPIDVVRITKRGDEVFLVTKVLEMKEPESQGHLMWIRGRALTPREWDTVMGHVQRASLWSAPTIPPPQPDSACGHPECYLVELVDGPKQRVLYECPCNNLERAFELAEHVADLARCP